MVWAKPGTTMATQKTGRRDNRLTGRIITPVSRGSQGGETTGNDRRRNVGNEGLWHRFLIELPAPKRTKLGSGCEQRPRANTGEPLHDAVRVSSSEGGRRPNPVSFCETSRHALAAGGRKGCVARHRRD